MRWMELPEYIPVFDIFEAIREEEEAVLLDSSCARQAGSRTAKEKGRMVLSWDGTASLGSPLSVGQKGERRLHGKRGKAGRKL